jgi:hypothetical protein
MRLTLTPHDAAETETAMRSPATVAISTINQSTLPMFVKSMLCQAVDDAAFGHTTTANWIPVRSYTREFCTARDQTRVEDIIANIDLGAIARGGGA